MTRSRSCPSCDAFLATPPRALAAGRRRLLAAAAMTVATVGWREVRAATRWRMATEYPATAIPGLGVAEFAAQVRELTAATLVVEASYDAALVIRSAEMLEAVRTHRLEAADAFAGALGKAYPLLGLSSLPFVADSLAAARALDRDARPAYARLLQGQDQVLLYTTPWPASGIWSREPIRERADLARLKIRTYDETSRTVFEGVGARAVTISFADAMPRIAAGEVNAVLSSGDGGAGRRLWEHLRHFTAIDYAMPISIATVDRGAWQALAPAVRDQVATAAARTDESQWRRIETRLAENYTSMTRQGVRIARAPADVRAALRDAASAPIRAWLRTAGADGVGLLVRAQSRRRADLSS